MSVVPSLVGAGTVVAVAATGLIIGQASESTTTPPSTSYKRKLTSEFGTSRPPLSHPPPSRPGTSHQKVPASSSPSVESSLYNIPAAQGEAFSGTPGSIARQPRHTGAQTSQTTPPKLASRRHSFVRQADHSVPTIAEHSRDSISSNSSWMKRLSLRPISQHGSPRSSVFGLESPSIDVSLGSAAPILSPLGPIPPQLPPNKLVKRATSGINADSPSLTRRGSRSQMPTLRRPATSHQRSATLQQLQPQPANADPTAQYPKYSFDQQPGARYDLVDIPAETYETPYVTSPGPASDGRNGSWTSFFHSRIVRSVGGSSTPRSYSGSPSTTVLPGKRLHSQPRSMPKAVLINTSMLSTNDSIVDRRIGNSVRETPPRAQQPPRETVEASPAAEDIPAKRARRSISMHFSSPTSWIPRTGSIRRPRRGTIDAKSGKRHVSAPTTTAAANRPQEKPALEDVFTSSDRADRTDRAAAAVDTQSRSNRRRNASSPLPPLSRLSSFNVDLSRLGLATPSPSGPARPSQNYSGVYALSQTSPVVPTGRTGFGERTFTMASSDQETRDFTSADDDDTDFKSETMFDSFRTMGSNRLKNVETPLESMFDESPPSTAGNGKTKRLSIQEILGRQWDGDTKITEEDEGLPTPGRDTRSAADEMDFRHDDDDEDDDGNNNLNFDVAALPLPPPNSDFGFLSLDDDDDDDWARDDENALSNHLSPPNSVNSRGSRGASSNHRVALANISGNGSPDDRSESIRERPQSKLFEWSELPSHDKLDHAGSSPRPKTVHGQQEMDLRGGRPANRKGPTAAHVRSQSVPTVGDPAEPAKSTPKYGTWGLSTKPASEDWDDEFDFGGGGGGGHFHTGGESSAPGEALVVPASIQAAQLTVKAHSGQIRELSLLVNDLKRLCRHGRELGILNSPAAAKWQEAENIITLASPDEEVAEENAENLPPTAAANGSSQNGQVLREGFEPMSLDDEESELARRVISRERHSPRRRSVFSPEDDIFGGALPWLEEEARPDRPQTPPRRTDAARPESAVIASVMEAMQQQRSAPEAVERGHAASNPSDSKLFFDTNSLQELVKRASHLRDALSDLVRKAEPFTQSPVGTPRRERHKRQDSSPAFTRVFSNKAQAMTVN